MLPARPECLRICSQQAAKVDHEPELRRQHRLRGALKLRHSRRRHLHRELPVPSGATRSRSRETVAIGDGDILKQGLFTVDRRPLWQGIPHDNDFYHERHFC